MARGLEQLIEFLKAAFDAEVTECLALEDGKVLHAEARNGDSMIMMGDPRQTCDVPPASLYLYVEDCDAVYRQALAAGAESVMEPTNMFYGDRNGGVKDPKGNTWWIATHIEDVSPDELRKRTAAMKAP